MGKCPWQDFAWNEHMVWKKKRYKIHSIFFTVSICGEWAVKIHVCVLLIIIFLAGGNTGVLVYFFLKKSLLWLVHDASLFITSVLPGLLFLLLVVSCLATWAKSGAVSVWCTDCWNFVMFVTWEQSVYPPLTHVSQGRDYVLPSLHLWAMKGG